MIKSDLDKGYKSVIKDGIILRNFQDEQEGNGGQRPPAQAFKTLMLSINQVKTNVENTLNEQIAESLGEHLLIVENFI